MLLLPLLLPLHLLLLALLLPVLVLANSPLLFPFAFFLGSLFLLGLFLLLWTLQRLLAAWSMPALHSPCPHVHPCLLLLHELHTYRPVGHLLIHLLLAFSFRHSCILCHHSLTQCTVTVLLLILLLCDF
jgi:hypothetical protein